MTTIAILAVVFIILGIIVLVGKGDWMIAGFNTASEEQKSKYDIKKLRLLVGLLLILVAPVGFLLELGDPRSTSLISLIVIGGLCVIVVVLANTWAKKKDK